MFSLPSATPPAAARRAVTVDSYGGTKPRRIFDAQVVSMPRVQKMSLMPSGTPASGPGSRPALRGGVDGVGAAAGPLGVDEQVAAERAVGARDSLEVPARRRRARATSRCARRPRWRPRSRRARRSRRVVLAARRAARAGHDARHLEEAVLAARRVRERLVERQRRARPRRRAAGSRTAPRASSVRPGPCRARAARRRSRGSRRGRRSCARPRRRTGASGRAARARGPRRA